MIFFLLCKKYFVTLRRYLFLIKNKNSRTMDVKVKKINSIEELLEKVKKRNEGNKGQKKTLAKHYGCLIRGYDGLKYQREVRYGTEY